MTRKNRKNGRNEQSRSHRLDDDAISKVLDAFQEELPAEDEVDLDTLFSDVLGKGLLSDKDIDEGFEEFLNRRVRHDRVSGRAELEAVATATIGERIRGIRSSRNLTPAQAAAELKVPTAWIEALEASEERYELSELFSIATRLSDSLGGVPLRECVTFLQRLRVIDTIGRTDGLSLKAARKIADS